MQNKTKATCRHGRARADGRIYNANHNCREETRNKENHIDHERTKENWYFQFFRDRIERHKGGQGGFDVIDHERQRYKELYSDSVKAKNDRYIKSGHKEDCKTTDDLYNNKRTTPMETILQIGNTKTRLDKITTRNTLQQVGAELVNELKRTGFYVPLSMAFHYDEQVDHIHLRGTFAYRNKDGHLEPNQRQALQGMGFERPNLDEPRDRHNNELVAFSDYVRTRFYDLCEQRGIEIDREVKSPSQRHKDILEQKVEQLQAELAEKEQLLEIANKRVKKGISIVNDAIKYTSDKALEILERAKECFQDIQNDLQSNLDIDDEEIDLDDIELS